MSRSQKSYSFISRDCIFNGVNFQITNEHCSYLNTTPINSILDSKSGFPKYRDKTHIVFQQYRNHLFLLSRYFLQIILLEKFSPTGPTTTATVSILTNDSSRAPSSYIRLIISRFVDFSFATRYRMQMTRKDLFSSKKSTGPILCSYNICIFAING